MGTASEPIAAAEQAVIAARRGDPSAIAPALSALGDATPVARAWRIALRAVAASLDPDLAAPPGPGELDGLPLDDERVRGALALAGARMVRAAVLALDGAALPPWIELLDRVEAADPRLAGPAATARLWQTMLGREAAASGAAVDALLAAAAGEDTSSAAVEATALRALVASAAGGATAALEHARRACRAAEGSGRPEDQHVAHLVLARLRRRHGRPQAAQIELRALAASVPPAWLPCVACELALAGAEPDARRLLARFPAAAANAPIVRIVRAMLALLDAARAGNRGAFDVARATIRAALPAGPVLGLDGRALAPLLDPGAEGDSTPVAAWRAGERAEVPYGLGEWGPALVHAAPGQRARRLLGAGVALLGPVHRVEGDPAIQTAIAALALAGGDGSAAADLGVAAAAIDAGLAGAGRAVEATGRLTLSLDRAIVVGDPRCHAPLAEVLLHVLVSGGPCDAATAAGRAGASEAEARRTLDQLVIDGVCRIADGDPPRYEPRPPALGG